MSLQPPDLETILDTGMDLSFYVDTAPLMGAIEILATPICAPLDVASIPAFVLDTIDRGVAASGENPTAEHGRPLIDKRRRDANLLAWILELARSPYLVPRTRLAVSAHAV